MKWKKHGKWICIEDKDFNSLRWELFVISGRLSRFARSLPFDWKSALFCWPLAIVCLVFLFLNK
jgi:hypothetical protein